MGILYPGALDTFTVPSLPEDTSLSSAGTSNRNHTESHRDLGLAVMALQANSAQLTHDHSGGGGLFATPKLDQANTHQNVDTDLSALSIHHTIGPSATQAAPGNHAHDYAGPSIFNKPFIVCTSTTRPVVPFLGQMIFETDTNCYRCWGVFKEANTVNTGLEFKYIFNTANSADSLDPALFSTVYTDGLHPRDGAMGAPTPGNFIWKIGANVQARGIARALGPTSQFTTDNQNLDFIQGTITFGTLGQGGAGGKGFYSTVDNYGIRGLASNDFYLRMSADGQSYVRFAVLSTGVSISYTTSGPDNEVILTGAECQTHTPGASWQCKAIGNTYSMYSEGKPVVTFVDNNSVVNTGPNYRGWGIGMGAGVGRNCQFGPNNITQVVARDEPAYATQAIWQLLNIGAVPHVRAESRYSQAVTTSNYLQVVTLLLIWLIIIVIWIGYIVDWHVSRFMELETSNTDITVQEAGTYAVHASIVWDPRYPTFNQSGVRVSVNGVDINRTNWQYMNGLGRTPDVAQSHDMYFTYYFAVGDIVRVHVGTNSHGVVYTYYNPEAPNVQTCFVELDFLGPT